jgi:hypothetical protein
VARVFGARATTARPPLCVGAHHQHRAAVPCCDHRTITANPTSEPGTIPTTRDSRIGTTVRRTQPLLQVRSWELFAIVATAVRSSARFRPTILSHIAHAASSPWVPATDGATTDRQRASLARVGSLVQKLAHSVHDSLTVGEQERKTVPSLEEVTAAVQREGIFQRVFFVDGTFEHISYSINTTVEEAAAQVAHTIGLRDMQSFKLFAGGADTLLTGGYEGYGLSELPGDLFIGDVLRGEFGRHSTQVAVGLPTVPEGAELPRDVGRGGSLTNVRLLFKKRLFRAADSETPDAVFAALCYAQALVEYMAPGSAVSQGCTADAAAELCALQMQGEYEQQLAGQPDLIVECIRM